MNEKIAVVTTGGTIASVISGSSLTIDPTSNSLREEILQVCKRCDAAVEVYPILNKHSEDLHPSDWHVIAEKIRELINSGVTKILVTHGTDSLAYTANALAIFFDQNNVKICLTGSFLPLDAKNSDAPLNLIAALHALTREDFSSGVYVAFRASKTNKKAVIIHAFDLKPMDFDQPAFQSVYERCVATYNNTTKDFIVDKDAIAELEPLRERYPSLQYNKALDSNIANAAKKVVCLAAYPGMNLNVIDKNKVSCIILSLYHSGTAPSLDDSGGILDFMNNNDDNIPILCSAWPSRYLEHPYTSTEKLIKAGVYIYNDIHPHFMYTFVVLGLSQLLSLDEVMELLMPWLFVLKKD
jgi:L-asparaginase/Glu-tRNA(Gln) amidotransferase subunit D